MSVHVRYEEPPNRAALDAWAEREGIRIPDSVIVTYWPHVYVPSGRPLTPALEAHEMIHLIQQREDVDGWWDRYFEDVAFRFEQELEAHRAEWRVLGSLGWDRNRVAKERIEVAKRLAGPLYGRLVKFPEALDMLRGAE